METQERRKREREPQNQLGVYRRMPVIVSVLMLVAQTAGWIWWAATFSSTTTTRLDAVESRQKTTEVLPERMARQEALQESTNLLLKDIRDELRGYRANEPLGRVPDRGRRT